ncbi:hypothetical protein ACQY0O_006467 [Thecaphora frezii]
MPPPSYSHSDSFDAEGPDHQEAGGFLAPDHEPAGGFLPSPSSSSASTPPSITRPAHLPLSSIPDALAALGLNSADPDVLDLFASTAYLPPAEARRRLPPGANVEKVVARHEFQQVVEVLLAQQAQHPPPKHDEEHSGRGTRRSTRTAAKRAKLYAEQDQQDDEDDTAEEFQDQDEESGSQEHEEDQDYSNASASASASRRNGGEGKRGAAGGLRRKRRKANHHSPSLSEEEEGEASAPRLNPNQRDQAYAAFQLLLERIPPGPNHDPSNPKMARIGFQDIKRVAQALGESLADKDIEEMLDIASALFAPASSPSVTRVEAQRAREAAKGKANAQLGLQSDRDRLTIGLDEYVFPLLPPPPPSRFLSFTNAVLFTAD